MYEAETVLAAAVFTYLNVPCWGIVGHTLYFMLPFQNATAYEF